MGRYATTTRPTGVHVTGGRSAKATTRVDVSIKRVQAQAAGVAQHE